MPANFAFPTEAEYIRFLPETILILMGTLIMVLEGFAGDGHRKGTHKVALFGLFLAMAAACYAGSNPGPAFSDFLLVDGFGTFFRMLVLTVGILAVLCSPSYLSRERADSGEYYALILYSLVGQCILATANELIMVFIGLEISSIATYVLAGYLRDDKRNNESAIKYFLLGSFATAFLLYGVAWIYGLTGSTNLAVIRQYLQTSATADPALVGLAAGLMFVGFAFKVSAAPFQAWTPDVYQGAPAPVTAFMSAGPKAAAFAVFIRVYITAFDGIAETWLPVVWVSALATMVIGNFAALTQTNIKRVLAYSSIAHAGYVLVAVAAHSQIGTAAAMFYLASYVFMNIGAFALISHLSRQGERYVQVNDLAGLSQRQPVTAALFAIFLLSLIGVPLTGGFFGKFYIFKAALDSQLYWLTVLGLLNSAVAAYYYLRIIVVMYFHEPGHATESLEEPAAGIRVASLVAALAVVVLGVAPSLLLNVASRSSAIGR
ncbi:MAG: NADH-quinone oxidoreductase subunit N [Acidobacteria bacterium]|nr:NADH-quinone oxidoreductase subunit N [Acidobacteriota bacterium]